MEAAKILHQCSKIIYILIKNNPYFSVLYSNFRGFCQIGQGWNFAPIDTDNNPSVSVYESDSKFQKEMRRNSVVKKTAG